MGLSVLILKVLGKSDYGWMERDEPRPQQVTWCYLKSSTTGARTLEDLSLTYSEDTLDLFPDPGPALTETASNSLSHAMLGPKTDSSFCTPATSIKLVLYICYTVILQQGDLTCLWVFSCRSFYIYIYMDENIKQKSSLYWAIIHSGFDRTRRSFGVNDNNHIISILGVKLVMNGKVFTISFANRQAHF